jgi:pimeloyl-ACP methyl ester carboxylesterase
MPGPPVLLVHGFATSADRTWRDNGWIDLLRDGGRDVLAVDLLGHGNADKPHDPAAYARLEELVAEQLPGEPVDAIGFSMGARLILTLAADDPSRFNRIVTSGVGANLFAGERSELIADAIAGRADPENPVAQYFAGLASQPAQDREALSACMRSPRPPLDDGRLSKVTVPVLVVLGDRDFAGPPDPLVEALPDAELVVLRGVDHFATPKDFKFIDAALAFLGVEM